MLLWFYGVLRGALCDEFPKVSSENLILLVKSHQHATNQGWRRETESMRELTKRTKTDSQSINQSSVFRTVKTSAHCSQWLVD